LDNNSAVKFFKPLKDYWDNLEKQRRITYGIIAGVVLLFIIIIVLLLNSTKHTVLYSGLNAQEAGEIFTMLQEQDVDVKTRGTGTILVPEDEAEEIRMQLSAQGYPESGLNYDTFQNSTGFGTTDYEKQKYMQFQLQERLQTSIKSLSNVDDAIVTLNIPESSSFVLKSDKMDATASVIVKMKNGAELTKTQVKGIVGLVAKSVPGLTEDQIHIIDREGNTLNTVDTEGAELAGTQLELEEEMSAKYKKQIEEMLEPVFGVGKVIAGVRVSLNFDKQTTETTMVEPVEGSTNGIPISVHESEEIATGSDTAGNVGMDANGGAPSYPEITTGAGTYENTERTVNYEVSKIKDYVQKSEGNIDDISVSIILDSADLQAGADEKVRAIVAGATGIDPDSVIVQTMNFNGTFGNDIDSIFDAQNDANEYITNQIWLISAIIFGIILLIILVIIILVVRRNKLKEEQERFEALVDDPTSVFEETPDEELTEFTMKKSDQRRLIEKSIDSNPEFVAQLLRNWLDDYGN